MKYIIEIGNDGGESRFVGWVHDLSGSMCEVSRIIGKECFLGSKPIKRGRNGLLWNFQQGDKTRWIRVLPIQSAELYPTIVGCTPVRNSENYI